MAPKSSKIEMQLCEEISDYVDKLTTSGQKTLNSDTMKKLKNILKRSDDYVSYVHGLLVSQLEKEHAEIRLSTFQICDQLFNRSHAFRELILADFQQFMNLTTEADPEYSLPPPKAAANALKRAALDAIHQWNEKYGADYKKLTLGYNYLKNCRKMDFTGTHVRSQAEQRRVDAQRQRQDVLRQQRLQSILKEMTENSMNMKTVLVQLENCLKLLLPEPESFQIHGLMSPEHQPNFTNPFQSYTHRTPQKLMAKEGTVGGSKKTLDPSKIKGRRESKKMKRVSVKEEPSNNDSTPPTNVVIKQEPVDDLRTANVTSLICSDVASPVTSVTSPMSSSDIIVFDGRPIKTEPGIETADPPEATTKSSSVSASISHGIKTCGDLAFIKTEPGLESCSDNTDLQPLLKVSDKQPAQKALPDNCTSQPPTGQSGTKSVPVKFDRANATVTSIATEASATPGDEPSTSTKRGPETGEVNVAVDTGEDEFQEMSSSDGEESDNELDEADVVRDHGLMSQLYRIQVELNPADLSIQETEDNTDLLQTLRDLAKQITFKLLPQVHRWLEVLAKTQAEQRDIQKAIDIKNALELAKTRTSSFRIIPMDRSSKSKDTAAVAEEDQDEDDDDDFEDVPEKEGYEDDIPAHLREPPVPKRPKPRTNKEWQFPKVATNKRKLSEEIDPTTPHATLKKIMVEKKALQETVSRSKEPEADISAVVKKEPCKTSATGARKDVPVIPYGVDLFEWGEKKETPLVVRYESSHRFWNTAFDEDPQVDQNALASMNTRVINFTGDFEPIKWSCRAPLQNGTLCPRRDKLKCPFHGKIISRDNMGRPSNPEDAARLAEEEIKNRKSEWDDPELQAEIEASTGISLNPSGSKKLQKKGKRQKDSGLTDIKRMQSTSMTRLQKKILSPSALRRVEGKMAIMNDRRYKDKFGNNYNYAVN